MSRPSLPILISYTAGLIAGYYLRIPFHILIGFIFATTSLTAASILVRRRSALFFICSLAALFFLGLGRMNAILYPFLPENHIAILSDEPLSLEGIIQDSPERLVDRTRMYVDISACYVEDKAFPVTGKLLLTVGSRDVDMKSGERIRLRTKVKRPRNFHNPGGFDYEKYLALRGVFATAFVKDAEGIVKTADGELSFTGWIEEIRSSIRGNVFKSAGTSAPILLALITGEQGEIPKDVREEFSIAGTAHILAISGEHVGLITMLSFAALLWLLRLSEGAMLTLNIYKTAAILTIPAITIYSMIAGGGFSIVRSAIMGSAILTAVFIERRKDMPSLVAFAAFAILLFEPQALFDISFQLSFASVLSLMLILPSLKGIYRNDEDGVSEIVDKKRYERLFSHVKMLVLVSIAATVGTAPIVAYYFNRLSLISPISNLIMVPIVGFITVPLGLLSSLLIPVAQPVSDRLISINSWLISLLVKLNAMFAALPMASIRVVTPNLFEMILFYTIIILIIFKGSFKWSQRLLIISIPLLLITESFYYLRPQFQQDLNVTFLDIGQAESALIEFPGGKTMLIDGGGSPNADFDVGEKVVAPFLWHKRIRKLDYVVLSHPNSDHYGGLPFVIRNFDVGEVWESGIDGKSARYADFKKALGERSSSRIVGDGDTLNINKTSIRVLNPPRGYTATDDRAANNGSLVLKLIYGNTSFLFTGDIEKTAEERLAQKGNNIQSTVLKVPHHGSLTSSSEAFLEQVRPETAVFSVGYKNHFGFPKEIVLRRYKIIRSDIYRTDQNGAITASADGSKIRLSGHSNYY